MSSALASLATSICYVRLAVRDLDAGARFASDTFGLQRVGEQDGEIAFRSDGRFRTVSLVSTETESGSIGVEVWDEAALERAAEQLGGAGFPIRRANKDECERRYVEAAWLAKDASGNSIDLVVRPRQSGRRYFPSRDAGIVQFQGVGLRTIASARDLAFWKILGARVSDWVGDIAYLQIDELHHRVALYPAERSGLLYSAFEVEGSGRSRYCRDRVANPPRNKSSCISRDRATASSPTSTEWQCWAKNHDAHVSSLSPMNRFAIGEA